MMQVNKFRELWLLLQQFGQLVNINQQKMTTKNIDSNYDCWNQTVKK